MTHESWQTEIGLKNKEFRKSARKFSRTVGVGSQARQTKLLLLKVIVKCESGNLEITWVAQQTGLIHGKLISNN